MFNVTVVCQECEGTTRLWGWIDCWDCDEGHKTFEENYETMEDAREDYPHAVKRSRRFLRPLRQTFRWWKTLWFAGKAI